jgi:hypothetical protein
MYGHSSIDLRETNGDRIEGGRAMNETGAQSSVIKQTGEKFTHPLPQSFPINLPLPKETLTESGLNLSLL